MCLLYQSGVTGGGLDPYDHYNTCFFCKHQQHVDGKIWKSTIVLFMNFPDPTLTFLTLARSVFLGQNISQIFFVLMYGQIDLPDNLEI